MVARRRTTRGHGADLIETAEGFVALHERLRRANRENPAFDRQYERLSAVLQRLISHLATEFAPEIESVVSSGAWADEGIDLRGLPYDDVLVDIIVPTPQPSFDLYESIARRAFVGLDDDDVFLQFRLIPADTWRQDRGILLAGGPSRVQDAAALRKQ